MYRITYNALCSDGTDIWGIDTQGVIYGINTSSKTVKILHWIEEIDDADGHKFPVMCHIGGKLLIAPGNGQKFWEYDLAARKIRSLTDASQEDFVNFYEWKDRIYFVGRERKSIAVYNKKTGSLKIKETGLSGDCALEQSVTRGGCQLDDTENRIAIFEYGSEIIYEFGLGDRGKKENEINIQKPVAFAHKINGEMLVVAIDGKFYLKTMRGISELKTPEGYECNKSPFHYWTRRKHGVVFMPCGINMVLYYADGKVKKICDSSTKTNDYEQMGIFPCCAYGESRVAGFSKYDDNFMEIDVEHKNVDKIMLRPDGDWGDIKRFINAKSKNGMAIREGYFGIYLNNFIQAAGFH